MASIKYLFGILLLFFLSVSNACFYADTPGTVYNLTGDLIGNKSDGFCITINASNVTIDCNGHSITGDTSGTYGIVSIGVENITITNCTISNYYDGIHLESTHNSNLIDNVVHTTDGALVLLSSNNNILANTTAYDSTYGFYIISGSQYNNFTNNTIYNINSVAFYLSGSNYNTLSNNTLANTTAYDSTYGFYLYNSHYNNLTGNIAYNIGRYGFLVYYSTDNILYDNNAYDNSRAGFYVIYSDNTDIDLATTQGSWYGFYIRGSNNVNLASGTSHSNYYSSGNAYGIYVLGPGTVNIIDAHLYNQSAGSDSDFYVVGDPVDPTIVDIDNMTIDNPQGNFQNYTRLYIYDVVDLGTSYNIEWSAQPAALPSFHLSFRQKYVDIFGSTVIDGISFHWLDSELSGYDETKFELWKYNASGWNNTNASLNIGANYLSLTNMNPESTYGILQYTPPEPCQVINSPGSYQKSANSFGAPFSVTGAPLGINSACVVIASSDVDFSCNGYTITNNGTANAAGIIVNGSAGIAYTNVTIRDCPSVSNYDIGITISNSNYTHLRNSTTHNNTIHGVMLFNSDFNNLTGNTAYNNSEYGFYLVNDSTSNGSDYNILTDNMAYLNNYSFTLWLSSGNNLTDNTAHNNALNDFYLYGSSNNNLINNTAHDTVRGFNLFLFCYNNNLIDNDVYNSGGAPYTNAFEFTLAHNTRVIGNTVLNADGFQLWSGNYNVFEDNTVNNTTGPIGHGFNILSGMNYNNFTNNVVHNFELYGFAITGTGNRFVNNTAHDFSSGTVYNRGFLAYSDTNSVFINNTAYNTPNGFETYGSTNLMVSDMRLYDNSRYGLYIRTPNNVTISDVHLYNNGVEDVNVDNIGGINTILNISNFTIDNPAGNYQNYTTFFVDDAISTGDGYTITWIAEPIIPPPTHFSFAQKYSAISPTSGSPSIDMIRWTWLDSELAGYNESKFEIWRYNAGWSNVSGQVRNTANNFIEIPGFAPSSYYGILQNNNTAPSITIESPANNTNTSSTDLNYTVHDANPDSCWYYLDGTGPTALPGCANASFGPLGDGPHNITVFANDTFGEQNSTTVYFVLDATPPTVSIQSPVNSSYYNVSIINLNYTVSDNFAVDSCWYYLDGAGPTALPATCQNITLPALSDGQHNVTVYVNDTANNTASDIVYFIVDLTPPSIVINSPANTTYNTSNDVDMNYTALDNFVLDSCWYYLNGAGPTPLPNCTNITLASLANGQYNLTIFANDSVGNQNSSNVSFTVNVPPPPPTGGRGGGAPRCTDASVEMNYIECPDNKIIFTVVDKDTGAPAVDARVVIKGLWPWSDVKYAASDGTVEFFAPIDGGHYQVFADGGRMEDYCSDTLEFDYTVCPEDVCYDNNGCADTEYCEAEPEIITQDLPAELLDYYVIPGICLPVECECGEARNHACEEYECCADTECEGNYACEEHECVYKPECESDADCADNEYCSDGECVLVKMGECGRVENHAWVDYECCNDGDCPSGLLCLEHECNTHRIETKEMGYVTPEERPTTIVDEILNYFWWLLAVLLLIILLLVISYLLLKRKKTKK